MIVFSRSCEKCSLEIENESDSQTKLFRCLPVRISFRISKLFSFFKRKGVAKHPEKIKEFLSSERTYTLHKPALGKYKRNKVTSLGIDYLWQLNLVDMQKFSKLNKGYKYLLTCIDVFSKYAWVKPIKTKEGNVVLNAFKKILKDGRKPEKIQTDVGKEFINKLFKAFLHKKNISIYIVNSEPKASVVERFNRTIKEKIW